MAYTPTVYTNDASSPDLNATNLNKTENGIKDAHLIAAPVDCTSRVSEYTGDGGGATVKDRAGNGNNLTATNITYVNGKYGKEMSFNGSTSYAQASSPVIGTTGTVAVRFKRSALGTFQYMLANLNSSGYKGVGINFNTSNMMRLVFGASATTQIVDLTTIAETAGYHTLVFTFSASTYYALYDLTEKTGALTNQIDVSATNLILGGIVTTPSFNGIISHFRYDSRIWTADEARAWSLNPISIDSRV